MNFRPTLSFLIEFRRALGFGTLCSFLSGFGQTYFVSLFVPHICDHLGVHPGDFGPVYASATLISGLLIARVGRHADEHGDAAIFYPAGFILAAGLVLLSRTQSLLWALPAVFAIRFGGQGSLGLLSGTAMARNFVQRRGMALSIASLGYPAGEMILPGLVVVLISHVGWQNTLPLLALALVISIMATGALLLRKPLRGDVPLDPTENDKSLTKRFLWYKNPLFVFLMLSSGFSGSFTGTILFLYQIPIAESKGWSAAWMATSFSIFALTRATLSIISGPLIDRWSGARLLPFIVLPIPFALLLLRHTTAPAGAWLYYILLGTGFGMGGAQTAFLAERYGRNIIGQVRGAANAFMVLFSAAGPMAAGILLKRGWTYNQLIEALTVTAIICLMATWMVGPLHRRFPLE